MFNNLMAIINGKERKLRKKKKQEMMTSQRSVTSNLSVSAKSNPYLQQPAAQRNFEMFSNRSGRSDFSHVTNKFTNSQEEVKMPASTVPRLLKNS